MLSQNDHRASKWLLLAALALCIVCCSCGRPDNVPENGDRNVQLLGFASRGDLKAVKWLIKSGKADPNYATKTTPLLEALINRHDEVALYLLAHGANVNTKPHSALAPIEVATACDNLPMMKRLLKKGALPLRYSRGVNALSLVKSREAVDLLWKYHAIGDGYSVDIIDYILYDTEAGNERYALLEYMFSKGLDVNYINSKGETALAIWIKNDSRVIRDQLERVFFLLKHGANPNLGKSDGTPYQYLLYWDQFDEKHELLKIMIASGLKLSGQSPSIIFEHARKYPEIVPLVLNADPNLAKEKNRDGVTALQYHLSPPPGAPRDYYESDAGIIKQLLAAGAEVNALTPNGQSALSIASNGLLKNNDYFINILLMAGADPLFQDKQGLTPFDSMTLKKQEELLAKKYVKPNSILANGSSLLIHAILKSDWNLVRLLLFYKVDPNFSGKKRHLPIYYAIRTKNTDIADALLNAGATVSEDCVSTVILNSSSFSPQVVEKAKDSYSSLIKKSPELPKILLDKLIKQGIESQKASGTRTTRDFDIPMIRLVLRSGINLNDSKEHYVWDCVENSRRGEHNTENLLQLLELLTTHGVQCGGSLYWLLKDGSPNFEVAAFLASHGANLRVKGDDGYELYQSTTTELRAFFRALDPSLR